MRAPNFALGFVLIAILGCTKSDPPTKVGPAG